MKYSHKGNAKATTLASPCAPTDMTVNVADGTGYPDGTNGPFWIALSKGQLIEEKILCSSRSGNLFQVWSDGIETGRGKDDTTAQDHPVNSPVEHVWTGTEAEQTSAHIAETVGAHGYPNPTDLVTTTGVQDVHDKNMIGMSAAAPVLDTPDIDGGTIDAATITGGTHTGATKISVTGEQAEAEFRVRNVYIGTGTPSNAIGSNGDLYLDKG